MTGGGQPLRHFPGERRPREHPKGRAGGQELRRHLVQETAARRVEPLGRPQHPRAACGHGGEGGDHLRERMAGHGDQMRGRRGRRFGERRLDAQAAREALAGKVLLVATAAGDERKLRRVAAPQDDGLTVARQRDREGGTPRARPEHRDVEAGGHRIRAISSSAEGSRPPRPGCRRSGYTPSRNRSR